MSKDILVIGLYGQSLLFQVANFPVDGETVPGELLSVEPGGKGFNQAVCIARQNIPVRFITAVGDDEYGSHLLDDCNYEGIDGSYSIVLPSNSTAIASVMSDKNASSRVIVAKGACGKFIPDLLNLEAVDGCSILLLQLELPVELALSAARRAKKNNYFIILNPAPATDIPQELIDLVDIVTPNLNEAIRLSGCSLNDGYELAAERMHQQGYKDVIITLGEDGAFVSLSNRKNYLIPAIEVMAVDSTGAGDNFNGALAASLFDGNSLEMSVNYAVFVSALSVTQLGVMASIPYKEEIDAFIDLHSNESFRKPLSKEMD
ncbi:MAG: ribokinase [Anaerolineaceae bacterium]|nr:ribokinase [Anaerolineaceae bacterium]